MLLLFVVSAGLYSCAAEEPIVQNDISAEYLNFPAKHYKKMWEGFNHLQEQK